MFGLSPKKLSFIVVILIVLFLARQYVPPFFSRFQFGDAVRQTVKYAASSRKDTQAIRREILEEAESAGVPITDKDVLITKRGPYLTVDIDYTWPIDLRVYQHVINFHVSESGEVFGQ